MKQSSPDTLRTHAQRSILTKGIGLGFVRPNSAGDLRFNMEIAKSLLFFVVAGICEIGGAYLVWLWLREGKPPWFGLLGAGILFLYALIQTQQPANFGRVFAAYGGIFIMLSILWGWKVDNVAPDRLDLIGGFIALAGVWVIMFAPRS